MSTQTDRLDAHGTTYCDAQDLADLDGGAEEIANAALR